MFDVIPRRLIGWNSAFAGQDSKGLDFFPHQHQMLLKWMAGLGMPRATRFLNLSRFGATRSAVEPYKKAKRRPIPMGRQRKKYGRIERFNFFRMNERRWFRATLSLGLVRHRL